MADTTTEAFDRFLAVNLQLRCTEYLSASKLMAVTSSMVGSLPRYGAYTTSNAVAVEELVCGRWPMLSLPNPSCATTATSDSESKASIDSDDFEAAHKMEDNCDAFIASKNIARSLKIMSIPYKDPDLGSKGFGATRSTSMGRLGSVSDYCVHVHRRCGVVSP